MGGLLGGFPAELLIVFVVMLLVAGPKRMITWAYLIGKYTAHLRALYQETITTVQKELQAAGFDEQIRQSPAVSKVQDEVMNPSASESEAQPTSPASRPDSLDVPEVNADEHSGVYDSWRPE